MEKVMENNQVRISGEIVSGFTFSHEVFGKRFYLIEVEVKRLSGQADVIPLMVSDQLLNAGEDYRGCMVEAIGQYSSYNRSDGTKNRLLLSVYIRNISFIEKAADYTKNNQIFLEGYICKESTYRITPRGRKITDFRLAVNRPNGKADYIPCIAWGRNAYYVSGFPVGAHLRVWGRVQSREYTKKLSETEYEKRVAYEVSVSEIEIGN